MIQKITNVGVYSESYEFESDYLPLISFKTQQQKDVIENYIFTKVNIFFEKIIKIKLDIKKSQVLYSRTITQKDFKAKIISYFYDDIFFDLGKRNSDNKLDFPIKWGITFDEKCAPIKVSFLSGGFRVYGHGYKPDFKPFKLYYLDYQWNYRYGTIDINRQPVFYYVYFTLQEILDEIQKISKL